LLSSSVTAIIEGVFVFFNIVSNYKYMKIFKLLVYLSAGAHIAVLLRGLHACNLLLLKKLFYFRATAFYKMSVEFLFKLLQNFKKRKVDINKQVNKQFYF